MGKRSSGDVDINLHTPRQNHVPVTARGGCSSTLHREGRHFLSKGGQFYVLGVGALPSRDVRDPGPRHHVAVDLIHLCDASIGAPIA